MSGIRASWAETGSGPIVRPTGRLMNTGFAGDQRRLGTPAQ
ncbi:hypothetical protein X805_40600 [Sphaerotilus natans subsp. natans DSM 6575]|uniref:Uncharacterized protein n=1 Tax=Sphaerotilus natans subsp. natans DSM 6575 TaxID=1286631 RepID=A0A059KGW5_9BURK|nr:hypothetical protein X805_40600 [Sphaerotilus natans subsp. natans DSM 6575]